MTGMFGGSVNGRTVSRAGPLTWGQWLAGLDPLSNRIVNGVPISTSLRDNAVGLLSGVASVPESLMKGAASAIDATGYGHDSADTLRRWSDTVQDGIESLAVDRNSPMFRSREVAGMIGATAPVGEIKMLQSIPAIRGMAGAAGVAKRAGGAVPLATRAATNLARYGDMALQGATANALVSRGDDVGRAMAIGAGVGPVAGLVADHVLPPMIGAGRKLASTLGRGARWPADALAPARARGEALFGTPTADVQSTAQDLASGLNQAEREGPAEFRDRSGHGERMALAEPDYLPRIDAPPGIAQWSEDGSPLVRLAHDDGRIVPQYGTPTQPGGRYWTEGVPSAPISGTPEEIEQHYSEHAAHAVRSGPGDMMSIAPIRQAATMREAETYASGFIGYPVMNDHTGIVATPSKSNLSKWAAGKTTGKSSSIAEHALAVANADELFRMARPIVRYPDPRGHPGLNISRWRAYLETPNGIRGIKITVKETAHPNEPNPLYSIEAMEVEPARSTRTRTNQHSGPTGPAGTIIDRRAFSNGRNVTDGAGSTPGGASGMPIDAERQRSAAMRRAHLMQRASRRVPVPAAVSADEYRRRVQAVPRQ